MIDRFLGAILAAGIVSGLALTASAALVPDVRAWFSAGGLYLALGAAAIGFGLARAGWSPGRLLMLAPRRAFAALAFMVALATGVWAHFAIQKGVPDVPDEFSYLHQARAFADGELAPPSPPLEEFHYTSWSIHDGGRWYSVFPPGYGVLLAAGVKAGVPYAVNPLLGALLALALFALGRDLFGGDGVGARAAVVIYLASWFRLMHAGSYMAHPTAALATVLCVLGVLRRDRWMYGAVAGASLAWLLATRPLNAVILGLVLVPVVLRPFNWRALVPMGLAALPLVLAYGAYNCALTGSALLPPQQRYMSLREEVGDCFRLGFGPGVGQCPITQNTNFGKDGFQPKDAVANTEKRIEAYLRYSFAFVPLALLAAWGALAGGDLRRRGLLSAYLLATVLGYGLFFYHGVAYGARFYYETFPFAALLGAAGVVDLGRRAGPRAAAPLGALWLALLGTGLAGEWRAVQEHAGKRDRTQNGALLAVLSAPEAKDAVIFADSLVLPAAMTRHPGDIDANHPIVVRDFGDAADAGYARLHGRPGFRWVGNRLVPLAFPKAAPIRQEGGALYPLEIARGGFGDRVGPDQTWKLPLSEKQALRFRAREAGAKLAWKTFAVDTGALTLHLDVVAYPGGPGYSVTVDEKPVSGALSSKQATPGIVGVDLPVDLTAGTHWIGIALDAAGTFFLDDAELRK